MDLVPILLPVTLAALVLSIWHIIEKLPLFDRFFPFLLQLIICGIGVFPLMHGTPSEHMIPMIAGLVWSLFALVSALRLYRHRPISSRVLGVMLFVQAVGDPLLGIQGYLRAKALYYWMGHGVTVVSISPLTMNDKPRLVTGEGAGDWTQLHRQGKCKTYKKSFEESRK